MSLIEGPEPAPDFGEAIIRVKAIGICGSDVHLYLGDHPYTQYPQVLGHEFAGEIAELYPDYEGGLVVGDRVAVEPLIACTNCYPCGRGRYNCCTSLEVIGVHRPGAMQDLCRVPVSNLHSIGDLPWSHGALVEPISIGVQAVARSKLEEDEKVLILGAGPIGQAVNLGVLERGGKTMVTDLMEPRLQLARKLGCDLAVNANADDFDDAMLAWTGGDGPAVVVDTTGSAMAARRALDLVAHSGRVVLVGVTNDPISVPVNTFVGKELTVLGSRNNAGVFSEALELVQRHGDEIGLIVSHTFDLENAEDAMRVILDQPESTMKVMIRMGS